MKLHSFVAIAAFTILAASHASAADAPDNGATKVPVVFSEGHETDGRDHGRPVNLVAGALGVAPEVFRDAFSRVHPAGPGSGGPTAEEARANKAALMSVLGKYGITNDRLDEASNYYRYVRSRGEMWPTTPAVANALVKNGVVTGFEVVSGGSGYTTPPTVSVPNMKGVNAKVELSFSKDFKANGAVSAITLAPAGAK